jgi:hypothetical protein
MMRPVHANLRRGYSLLVVLVTLILLFALWGAVSHTTASLLRIETNRVLQQTRDQAAMNALAQAVQLLQYGKPSNASNPGRTQFTYGVTVTVPNPDGSCGTATLDYTVTYTYAPAAGDANRWQVQVTPGTYSGLSLPQIGASPQWP